MGVGIMLVVIAEKEEMPLVEEIGLNGCPILITGVGAINVINALKDVPRDTEIFNVGYCGSKDLEVGTYVNVIKANTLHNYARFEEKPQFLSTPQIPKLVEKNAICYTSTDFVTEKFDTLTSYGTTSCVFDMELAFICALGFKHIASIKKVSDNLSIGEYHKNIN